MGYGGGAATWNCTQYIITIKVIKQTPGVKRPKGSHKAKYMDQVEEDTKGLKVSTEP